MGINRCSYGFGFRKGLTLFGDKGYQAAKNELKVNLLRRGCIDILSWKNLTWDIRKQALGYLIFLKRKRKRSGKMKGRGCADGRSQREYITKDESSSPTALLYALMGSCSIGCNGRQESNNITVDIPHAFLQGGWHKMNILDTSCLKESWFI